MTELDPVEGRQRERNHDGTRSIRRETMGDKPRNHDGTGSSRRETKADKGRQSVKSCWNKVFISLHELRTPSAEAVWGKMDPCTRILEGNQRETNIQISEQEIKGGYQREL